ncbi:MAG: RNA 3'-terminal phosphate cyclase [Thermodesulfobacteriota bacterium]
MDAARPIHVDGAAGSGSGTIVRFATAFAALLGRTLHVTNARVRRPKRGLRAQHVAAVRACAELCSGEVEGVEVGALEFLFKPGERIRGGRYDWDIGSAGSATMLALGILPVACFADDRVVARIRGGVFQDFAPSPFHMQHVLAPLLARTGAAVEIEVLRAGYVPQGAGTIELRVEPARRRLAPLVLGEAGTVRSVEGIAFASRLAERAVAERMARACEERLEHAGLHARIERIEDVLAARPGASLAVWAETSFGCRLGADRAGAPGRRSEDIGRFVAEQLLSDLASQASTDRHVADQLVPFAAVATGTSRYLVPAPTDHLTTNLWLAAQFGARATIDGSRVEIEGLGAVREDGRRIALSAG